MVCSFGDQNDVAVFRELACAVPSNRLKRMHDFNLGTVEGLSVLDARAKAIEMLEIGVHR